MAAVRFLDKCGADVTVTDRRPQKELAESLNQLTDCRLQEVLLGEHSEDAFRSCELLVVNPAVKPDNPFVEACRSRGVVITSEMELFLQRNPARTVAVTGSNGKSTTCQLIHDILRHTVSNQRRVWLGGNIGRSLLPHVDEINPGDIVVIELSSFQLHLLRESQFRPDVAVVTGFAANHLDWHGDLDHYRRSKQLIGQHQKPSDAIVLPDTLDDWTHAACCWRFGLHDQGENGVFIDEGALIVRSGQSEEAERLSLPAVLQAEHQRRNVAAAVAACRLILTEPLAIPPALQAFRPLPHRLQVVARSNGRCFVDDSGATTPESLIAALQSMRAGCVLIAGGHDKGAPLREAADEIVRSARSVVAIGNTAERLLQAIDESAGQSTKPDTVIAEDFSTAFEQAVALSRPGDIVLLSPGFASYGWFSDYRERGIQFSELARAWCARRDETS